MNALNLGVFVRHNEIYKEKIFFKFYLFYFLTVVGLCCCTQAFSSCGEQGLLFIAMCGLLIPSLLF